MNKKIVLGVELPVMDTSSEIKVPQYFYRFIARNDKGLRELYRITTESTKDDKGRLSRLGLHEVDWDNVIVIAPSEDWRKAPPRAYVAVTPGAIEANVKRAIERGLKPLAGSNNFYPRPEHYGAYEIISPRNKESKEKGLHIVTEDELLAHVPWCPPEAITETGRIYEQCNVSLPKAEMVKFHSKKTLREMCAEGAKVRDLDIKKGTYKERLDRELALIEDKKFSDYFFVMADMIAWAKKRMVVGPARGSSCGSLTCYLLGITDIDPIPYGLLFERFIDITRADLPDIDVDFQDDRRELVFDYIKEKYGKDRVARIGTISRYKSDSAIRDCARELRVPIKETETLKAATLKRSSGDARAMLCILDTFTENPVGRAFLEKFPAMKVAAEVEEHATHTGQHAAGIIITEHPVNHYCSVDLRNGVAQVDFKDAALINLLKIDALGLRTLSVINDVLEHVDKDYSWLLSYPLDDKKAFDVINKRKFCGIFQFEGRAVEGLCRQMPIKDIEDVIALTALARPGPLVSGSATDFVNVRTGKKAIKYLHPTAKPITEVTHGTVIYQEQVMKIGKDIGNLQWEEVNALRKAMGKSLGQEYFNTYWDKFLKGAKENGLAEKEAKHVWDHMCTMGSYGFNRSISGQTKVLIANPNAQVPRETTIARLYKKYVTQQDRQLKSLNRNGPVVVSLFPDGRGYPQRVIKIHRNGNKPLIKLTFEDGYSVKCTADHKFWINGKERKCSDAKAGDKFTSVHYEKLKINFKGTGKGRLKGSHYSPRYSGFDKGKNNPAWINGRTVYKAEFKIANKGAACEDCAKKKARMEAHHNDFSDGEKRPKDLAWLCASCHKKRHYKKDRRRVWQKGYIKSSLKLVSIKPAGRGMTYDLEMPTHHNFALSNGLITSNSHAVAYGRVSYFCCVLKSKWPLEFAAAQLRNSKGNDDEILILRELVKEGFKYVPVDPKKSELNWSVKGGVLYGGLMNIKGVGEVAAQKIMTARSSKALDKLPPALKAKLENPVTPFDNIFEAETLFADYYDDPESQGIRGHVWKIGEVIDQEPDDDVVILGKLKTKNVRDANETISVQKRGGKRLEGATLALNFRIADDTGIVMCRIKRGRDYEEMALPIVEKGVVDEDWYLVRGHYAPTYAMLFVDKVRKLEIGNGGETKVQEEKAAAE